MVEFLLTEDKNSLDSEKQSSEYFYEVSTSIMLYNITLHVLFSLTKNMILFLDILFHIFYLATLSFSIGSSLVFEIYSSLLNRTMRKKLKRSFSDIDCLSVL